MRNPTMLDLLRACVLLRKAAHLFTNLFNFLCDPSNYCKVKIHPRRAATITSLTSRNQSIDVLRGVVRFVLGIAVAALIVGVALSRPQRDFIEYWTVAHLFVGGHNCYSLPEVFRFEQALNWPEPLPLIPLNPPWLLPLLAPLGFLQSYVLGWILWTAVMTGAFVLSSLLLMNLYAADVRLPEISNSFTTRALFIFSFYPVILSVRFAQISGLILLGIVGFLWLRRKGHRAFAGSVLALTALKPQLVYLALLAAAVDCWRTRSPRTVLGFLWPIGLLIGLVAVINPSTFRAYLDLAGGPYSHLYPSAAGAILRLPFGTANTFYLQFLPVLFGLAWLALYLNRQIAIDLEHAMPMLIGVSVLTTPWGWLFDQALLAVPVVALFADVGAYGRIPRRTLVIYTGLNICIIVASLMKSFPVFYAAAPTVFILMIRNRNSPLPWMLPAARTTAR